MSVAKTLVVILLLMSSIFSGCTFLRQTHFTLLSLVIDDDQGFPRIQMQFNTSDTTELTLSDPAGTVLYSATSYAGIHNESIYFSGYRTTILPGTYQIKAVDFYKQFLCLLYEYYRCNKGLIYFVPNQVREKIFQ